MQIFIPFDTAEASCRALDKRRLHKQIIECAQIATAIEAYHAEIKELEYKLSIAEDPITVAFLEEAILTHISTLKHPVYKMYRSYLPWVKYYQQVAIAVREGSPIPTNEPTRPHFLGFPILHQTHKTRLFQKGLADSRRYSKPNHYEQFHTAHTSEENIYVVDQKVLTYLKGKLTNTSNLFDVWKQVPSDNT